MRTLIECGKIGYVHQNMSLLKPPSAPPRRGGKFVKKTRKTPRKAIKIAEERKRDYLKGREDHA